MSVLHVRIEPAGDPMRRRIITALDNQGITGYRVWLDDDGQVTGSSPRGAPADREELLGQQVMLVKHAWARQGPDGGIFSGQTDRHLSVLVEGGGRFVYEIHEIRDVTATVG